MIIMSLYMVLFVAMFSPLWMRHFFLLKKKRTNYWFRDVTSNVKVTDLNLVLFPSLKGELLVPSVLNIY